MSTRVLIRVDGAARGNPGPAAIGAVIQDEKGKVLACLSQRIGSATNNQAEYLALIAGLERAVSLGATRVSVYSDSDLLVNQITGRYKVKNSLLRDLYQKVVRLIGSLEKFEISCVPREQNTAADNLANRALDSN